MKVISRKFTYDNFMSRIPGVLPSLVDSWSIDSFYSCNTDSENEFFFKYENAVQRAKEYNIGINALNYNANFHNIFDEINEMPNGNYGLVVSDIIIPVENGLSDSVTDYTDLYVNLAYEDENGNTFYYDLSFPKDENDPHYEFVNGRYRIYSGGTEIKVLKYSTLNKWYSFFREYYRIISNTDSIRSYSSATEYATIENKADIDYYMELDDIFMSRGGEKMYKWMLDNCFLQFSIPEKFTYEWKTTFLYYHQAIKWSEWFKQRIKKYEEYTDESGNTACKKTDDCCDCEEYVRRGGEEFYNILKAWLDSVKDKDFSFATNSASLVITLSLQTSIDDLGEMAIFSERWDDNTNYHSVLTPESGGTVCFLSYYDNGSEREVEDAMIIKDGSNVKGYKYENYNLSFKNDDWSSFTEHYIINNQEEFANSATTPNPVTSFTFSPIDENIIYNPSDEDIKIELFPEINKIVCINDKIYDVIENGKYVEMCYKDSSIANLNYKNGNKLPVVTEGELSYTIFNGKKYYMSQDELGTNKIYFLKDYLCKDDGCDVFENVDYIIYDDILYLTNVNCVTIENDFNSTTYRILDGIFTYNGKRFFLKTDDGGITYEIVASVVANYYDEMNKVSFDYIPVTNEQLDAAGLKNIKCEVSEGIVKVTLYPKYDINACTKITGITESKLELLRRREITTDDMGNELPGYFRNLYTLTNENFSDSIYTNDITNGSIFNNPYDECTLDILYKVGEVSCLKKNEFISKKAGYSYFDGNIIESIEFYYLDINGNRAVLDDSGATFFANNDNALETIKQCLEKRNAYSGDTIINDEMMCDITYYIGAIIRKTNNGTGYSIDKNYHAGIKYVDTLVVYKNTGKYYIDKDSFFTFNYYELKPEVNNIFSETYKKNANIMVSNFELEPMLFNYQQGASEITDIISNFDKFNNRWEDSLNFMASPVYRNEFSIGISTPQIVETNIYIDRGINSAFERHLKLQEFRTMDALENYGNNWFKIVT